MIKCIKKVFGYIKNAIGWVKYWIDYWNLKPSKEIVGLFIALSCAAVLFFLPSYDPAFSMTAAKFQDLCENNSFEMEDVTDSYFYVNTVVEDTLEDYTLKYYSCTKECYAKFFRAREVTLLRKQGGYERNVYNSEFQLTTFTDTGYTATVYRNGTEVLVVSGPKANEETLEKILKKCRIPAV